MSSKTSASICSILNQLDQSLYHEYMRHLLVGEFSETRYRSGPLLESLERQNIDQKGIEIVRAEMLEVIKMERAHSSSFYLHVSVNR